MLNLPHRRTEHQRPFEGWISVFGSRTHKCSRFAGVLRGAALPPAAAKQSPKADRTPNSSERIRNREAGSAAKESCESCPSSVRRGSRLQVTARVVPTRLVRRNSKFPYAYRGYSGSVVIRRGH